MSRLFFTVSLLSSLLFAALPAAAAPPPPLDATAPAYWRQALAQAHAPGEIVVAYESEARPAPSDQAASTALAGADLLADTPALGLRRYHVSGDLATALAHLNADPAVRFAEPNYYRYPDFEPDDPLYLSYAANDGATNGGYLNRMNMTAAWDMGRGNSSLIVAIIDSGIDLDHPDLVGAIWQNPGEIPGNGLDDDGNGLIDDVNGWNFAAENANVDDWYGHGSHVAGIVGARFNNGIGIAGIAPKVKLMSLGVFALVNGRALGTWADEVEAILYAVDNGARVINLSLGSNAYSRGEQLAVEYAVAHGVVVVASAGNAGREVNGWPAAHEAAIAVAATDASDTRASFSNIGQYVDVAAPGVAISSLNRFGGYVNNSGTSMAAPHVSGLAALVLSLNPSLSPAQVRTIIETTATDLGATGRDKLYGAGRVDAASALLATPPYADPWPGGPDWPQAERYPSFCQELLQAGDFEDEAGASWVLTGTALITDTYVASGQLALHLVAAPAAAGAAGQVVQIPSDAHAATISYAVYAASGDRGWGSDPADPGEDHVRAWLRTAAGEPLIELMSASNIGAAAAWDQTLHLLSAGELALLRQAGEVELWFGASNDADETASQFVIDDVHFCVAHAPLYLPLIAVKH